MRLPLGHCHRLSLGLCPFCIGLPPTFLLPALSYSGPPPALILWASARSHTLGLRPLSSSGPLPPLILWAPARSHTLGLRPLSYSGPPPTLILWASAPSHTLGLRPLSYSGPPPALLLWASARSRTWASARSHTFTIIIRPVFGPCPYNLSPLLAYSYYSLYTQ